MYKEEVMKMLLPDEANAKEWATTLSDLFSSYSINNPLRLCHFMAQVCHESSFLKRLTESLNYSSKALRLTWPSRFTPEMAEKYGRTKNHAADQVAIANIAYGGRLGNVDDGDGYKYRGRGAIQLTGKENYTKFSMGVFNNNSIVDNPDLLSTDKKTAALAAFWYWDTRDLNQFADADDIVSITKRINGGLNGLDDRKKLLAKFKAVFGTSLHAPTTSI